MAGNRARARVRARARKTVAPTGATSWRLSTPGPFSLTWQPYAIEIRVLLSAYFLRQPRGGYTDPKP